tara:strand:+ start:112 stop:270 length:159 start_codon:yes stop_codon:yes gene_type:complete
LHEKYIETHTLMRVLRVFFGSIRGIIRLKNTGITFDHYLLEKYKRGCRIFFK